MAGRGRIENLKPAKPGEVLNPEGRNQYSYRRDFEAIVDALLRSVYKFEPEQLSRGEGEMARCLVCNLFACDARAGLNIYAHRDCLTELDGKTRGEVIGLVAVQRALAGDEKMLPEILKRLWPAPKSVEHQIQAGGLVQFTWADLGKPAREQEPADDRARWLEQDDGDGGAG